VFDVYGDSSETLLDFLAVVIIGNPISSVCGLLAFHEKYICGCLDSLTNMQMAQHERGHEHECSTRHTYVQFVTDHSEGVLMCVHNSVAPPKVFSRDVPHIESRTY